MDEKLKAYVDFKDNFDREFYFTIDNYKGYIFETKQKTLKLEIEGKMIVFKNIKYETLKVKIIK